MYRMGRNYACDSLNRELIGSVPRKYGFPGKLARVVRSMYMNCEACVIVLGGKSGWFKVGQFVRQGCVMSPWLFSEGVKLEE